MADPHRPPAVAAIETAQSIRFEILRFLVAAGTKDDPTEPACKIDTATACEAVERQLKESEGHYDLLIRATDPDSGKLTAHRIPMIAPWLKLRLMGIDKYPRLQAWPMYSLALRLLRSSLFRGLSGRALAAAQTLAAHAITQACRVREKPVVQTLPEAELRRLAGMRKASRRIIGELERMIDTLKEMEGHRLLHDFDVRKHLEAAIRDLHRFGRQAKAEPTQTSARDFHLNRWRPWWMFRPPGIAYALFTILTGHSKPQIRARDAYRRIGTLEREYLGRKSRQSESEPEETIRRQVYTFRRRPERKQMDSILRKLLASEWYGLDHPLNCDWEDFKTHPSTAGSDFHGKVRNQTPALAD